MLLYVKKGNYTYYVDFMEHTFLSQIFILISKQQLHYFLPFKSNVVELLSVTFNQDFIYRNETDLKHQFQFTFYHCIGRQVLSVTKELDQKCEIVFNAMKQIYASKNTKFKYKAFYNWFCIMVLTCIMLTGFRHISMTLNF